MNLLQISSQNILMATFRSIFFFRKQILLFSLKSSFLCLAFLPSCIHITSQFFSSCAEQSKSFLDPYATMFLNAQSKATEISLNFPEVFS